MRKRLLLVASAIVVVATTSFFILTPEKEKQLECDTSHYTTSYHQFYNNKDLLQKAKEALKKGDYQLHGEILYAKHQSSTLKNYLKLESLNDILKEIIDSYSKKNEVSKQPVIIDYLVKENDRGDPNKKSDFCKMCGGSLRIDIIIGRETVYSAYSEYLRDSGKDLPKHIKCILNSFYSRCVT